MQNSSDVLTRLASTAGIAALALAGLGAPVAVADAGDLATALMQNEAVASAVTLGDVEEIVAVERRASEHNSDDIAGVDVDSNNTTAVDTDSNNAISVGVDDSSTTDDEPRSAQQSNEVEADNGVSSDTQQHAISNDAYVSDGTAIRVGPDNQHTATPASAETDDGQTVVSWREPVSVDCVIDATRAQPGDVITIISVDTTRVADGFSMYSAVVNVESHEGTQL